MRQLMLMQLVRLLGPGDPLGPVDQDPDSIREAACRLVAPDSACRPVDTTPIEPHGGGGGGNFLGALGEILLWMLFLGLVAAVIFGAIRVILATRGRSRRRRRGRDDDDQDEGVEELPRTVIDPTREPRQWRSEADEHRRAGRFRDAVRCRYRALVGDLARGGLVDEIPGRTSGEERAQMAVAAPVRAPAFAAAADLFDAAWFGDVPVADVDVERMERLERDVLVAGRSV
jgi:hypothetical protein